MPAHFSALSANEFRSSIRLEVDFALLIRERRRNHHILPSAMFRALFVIGLFSMCTSLADDAARQALNDARRLAKEGDYEGALAKHVWFHDNALTVDPDYYAVRLSFALTDWMELASKYPKALEKLKSVRDEKTARLERGEGNRALFHDVESINESLGEKSATVALFKKLEAVNSKFGVMLYDIADEALVEAGEYALARKSMGDPTKRLAVLKARYEDGTQFEKGNENQDGTQGAFARIFTGEVIRIITILRETGDTAGARDIQTEALKTLNSDAIRNALTSGGA